MSERVPHISINNESQENPIVREDMLQEEIQLDLRDANRAAKSAERMMAEANSNNDQEALAKWEEEYGKRKQRVDMLMIKYRDQIAANAKLKKYVESELNTTIDKYYEKK